MQNIRAMFESATLKLTAWYLVGIMIVSITFSFLVYNLAMSELAARLGVIGVRLEESDLITPQFQYKTVQESQYSEASRNLLTIIVYSNLIILGAASFGSYLWARRTLRPIEEAHEAQSRFTSDASHELRTPLAVMRSEIEMVLRDKAATKPEMKEVLQSNLEEVTRLTTLSTLLLKLAQLETSSLEWKEVRLRELAEQAVQTLAKPEQPRITITTGKKPPKLQANPESLQEAIIILLDNAIKFSPAGSPINVRLFRGRGKQCISVENEGKGIAAKDIEHIFERFYCANTSRSNNGSTGYGLGLSLAKKIVDLHHGEITVRSQPNEITKFTIKLP